MATFVSRRLACKLLRHPNLNPGDLYQSQLKKLLNHNPTLLNPSGLCPLTYFSTTTRSTLPLSHNPRSFPFPFPFSYPTGIYQSSDLCKSSSFSVEKPINPLVIKARNFSNSSGESETGSNHQASEHGGEFRHQEIVGPTVERDVSALANETRQVLESLRRSIYDLSVSLLLLGGAHLGLGAWIAYAVKPPEVVAFQGYAAFAFPVVTAFLMRRTLKPLEFFHKMEQQGRLQILTLTLQVSKNLRLMFARIRMVSVFCVVVECDVSAFANETRQALESLRRSIYDLSVSFFLLGGAHLGLGAWITYAVKPPEVVMFQGYAAFAFPVVTTFLMRQTLKQLGFSHKMEEQGWVQIPSLTLQVSKNLRLMFARIRLVLVFCIVGILVGSLTSTVVPSG